MRYTKLLICSLPVLIFLIAGCGMQPPTVKAVTVDHNIFVMPPKALRTKCHISAPPVSVATFTGYSKDGPLKASLERQTVLTDYVNLLLKDLGECNIQHANLNNWLSATQAEYSTSKHR